MCQQHVSSHQERPNRAANLLLYFNLTEHGVLVPATLQLQPSQVGYSNFAFAVGGLIGLVGPFSDWAAKKKATQHNNGVRETKMRLLAIVPYFILTGTGTMVGAAGYDHLWSWPVILLVGYGFTGLAVTTIPTIAIAYAVDCYKPISGEIMVVATVLKNTQGFGMSYWIARLVAKGGYITPASTQFAFVIGPALLGILLYFWGKNVKRWTKNSSLHRLEEML